MAPAGFLRDYSNAGKLFGVRFKARFLPPQYIEFFGGNQIGQSFVETTKALPIYEESEKYRGPVLIIHGLNDEVVPYAYSERYHQIYTNSKLILLPHTNHNFTNNIGKVAHLTANFFIKRLQH